MKSIGDVLYTTTESGGTVAAFRRVSARDAGRKEAWFRDAIFANPDLVIDPCRSAGLVTDTERWYPWAKEHAVSDSGSIDILLLSSEGRIGIVETKLSFNPERRREVVAQILDYAVALQETKFDFERLAVSDASTEQPPKQHDVEDALRTGRFLLIIAGDALEPRAIRLSEAILAAHLTAEWDLGMVDLNLYAGGLEGSLLLVPEMRGKLIHETRQVVRVTVEGKEPKATIQVERLPDPSLAERTQWTAESFSNALRTVSVSQPFRELVARLMDLARRNPTANVAYGTGKLGSITLRRGEGSIISFFLDGRAETKPMKYLEKALGTSGAQLYATTVERVWGTEFVAGWKRPRVDQVLKHGTEVLDAIEQAMRDAERPARTGDAS